MIISDFYKLYPTLDHQASGHAGFKNDDLALSTAVETATSHRMSLGLDGLVGDLACVIINVEHDEAGKTLSSAVNELLNSTGYMLADSYGNPHGLHAVLTCRNSADLMLTTRKELPGPFDALNIHPRTAGKPATRLETFVFECPDLNRYVEIQKARGVNFMTESPVKLCDGLFIQTIPSEFTGNSTGFVQWTNFNKRYRTEDSVDRPLNWHKGASPHLASIGRLDHAATRVRAIHRDAALIEFMELTNYSFAFAIHVPSLNSITNVARWREGAYAAVFTSGISPLESPEQSGPTERFIYNHGARVHHLAFETRDIDYTYHALERDGFPFLSELVGSEAMGIRQAFSAPSPHTFLVNEYIERYGGFEGFFTEENVTLLTKSTENQ